jgi:hypothetical protein
MVEGGDLFYDAIQGMAQFESFMKSIARLPGSFREMKADEELVLRFFAVISYREKYAGNIEEWLDSFMEAVLFKTVEFDIVNRRQDFEKVFNLINEKISDKGFTRFNSEGESVGRLAPAYFEATVFAFWNNEERIRALNPSDVETRLKSVFSDKDFIDSTGPGANTITKLKTRIKIASDILGA